MKINAKPNVDQELIPKMVSKCAELVQLDIFKLIMLRLTAKVVRLAIQHCSEGQTQYKTARQNANQEKHLRRGWNPASLAQRDIFSQNQLLKTVLSVQTRQQQYS